MRVRYRKGCFRVSLLLARDVLYDYYANVLTRSLCGLEKLVQNVAQWCDTHIDHCVDDASTRALVGVPRGLVALSTAAALRDIRRVLV